MKFTEEQQAFATSVADFCQRELGTREQRNRYTRSGRELHSRELYQKMADLGWTGIMLPETYRAVSYTHLTLPTKRIV